MTLLLVALLTALAPARFAERPGWHVGHDRVHACPGVPRSRCEQVTSWAATTPWRGCAECVPPHKVLAVLPRSGISIQLALARERNGPPQKRLAWPPRLRPGDVSGPVEGVSSRIGFAGRFGTLRGFRASLWVYFGRRHPTARQLARANAELRSAKLP